MPQRSPLTSQLARFVTDLRLQDIPAEGIATAKAGFADCLAVMIAGRREPVSHIVDREIASADRPEQASIIPTMEKRNVADAALINGVSAHVLDYDDVTLDGHPSAVLIPTIMAQAEVLHSSGADMITAYAAGYEVWAELLIREPVPLHQKGWHPTALRGTIASAAAASKLLRLTEHQTATAMAIAASMASGLVANFGSLTKCFQVGKAAQSGIIAARLARAGLTASVDALEHPSGFLAASSPNGEADFGLLFDPSNKEWYLVRQGLNIKRYPVCYGAHRAIDATIDLVKDQRIGAQDIKNVEVSTGQTQMLMLRNERPKTAFEAKFSMPFAIASAIVEQKVGLQQLTDEFVMRDDIQSLFPKVSYALTTETLDGSAFAIEESVRIETNGGHTFESPKIKYAKGSHQRPLTVAELQEKFDDCLGQDYQASSKARAFDRLMNLERINSASDLLALS